MGPLRKGKELRPHAKWGIYSKISGDRNLPTDERRRWLNDQASWLWNESDIITRSIYPIWLEGEPNWPRVRDLMFDKVGEAVRLANNARLQTGKRPMVFSYLSSRVAPGPSQFVGEWLTSKQIENQLQHSLLGGADGAIFWENARDNAPPNPTEEEYIEFLNTAVKSALVKLKLGAWK
ncbi:MAG: hypothetical protein COV44_03005 [Deltaproteobacteria bacterium CG11_big_fil_rev_8_21_14_0_20_45_16]|nr:MAG: hypothetical protein COV44_03005 [Deltaproteobacteria bacterium CG11_big_fil_rev_8_21_14_0_20_45_16]